MIEIAGGILLAVFILATMPLWLPIAGALLLIAAVVGVSALAIAFPNFGIAMLGLIVLLYLTQWRHRWP